MLVYFWLHTGSQPNISVSTLQMNHPATMEGPQVELGTFNHGNNSLSTGKFVGCIFHCNSKNSSLLVPSIKLIRPNTMTCMQKTSLLDGQF